MPDTDLNHEFEQRAQRIAERCEPYAKPVGQVAFEIEEAQHEAYLAGVKSASVLSAVGSSSLHESEQEQHPAALGGEDAMDWISAAKRLGELLAPDGPDGYYRFTPQQWFDWAKTKVSSSAAPSLRGLTRYDMVLDADQGSVFINEQKDEDGRWVKFDECAALLSGKGK